MPELPEVESIKRQLKPNIIGKIILEVVEIIKPYRLPAKKPAFAKASSGKEERKEYIANFQKEIEKNKEIKRIREVVKRLALGFAIP